MIATTTTQTPGDRACRYAMGAESVFLAYATDAESDMAWGFNRLAGQAGSALIAAVEAGDLEVMENISCHYAQLNAIIAVIAKEAEDDLLFAGEALMEVTKEMLDAEVVRLLAMKGAQP